MWSEDSFTGRASRALRNDLQNASSDMMGYNGEVAFVDGLVVFTAAEECL